MDTLSGQVVYLAPDFAEPSGGVRAMYRHVETAVAAGIDAKIWHHADGFRCDWFDSDAPVVTGAKLELAEDDLLVVPEVFVLPGFDPAPGCRKVIYNQNHFYTFDHWSGDDYPEWTPEPAVWASSETSVEVLRKLHPKLTTSLVPYVIDLDLFAPARRRSRKVVLMPRKRPREAALLMALFRADDRFADVELVAVEDLTERQTADHLASASVFVALGHEEGFGLPVAEALAAGCVVVGYPAGGGAELFTAPGTHVAADADVLGIVDQLAGILAHPPTAAQRRGYRDWVAGHYGQDRMRERLLAAIETARRGPASGGTAKHPLAELSAAEVPERDDVAEHLARSEQFAHEQQAAREHAEQIAHSLEQSLRDTLEQLAEQRRETSRATQELADLRHEYTALRTAAERLTVLDQTAALLAEYTRENDQLSRAVHDRTLVEADLRLRIADLEQSTSWRATAPLRKVTEAFRGGRHG